MEEARPKVRVALEDGFGFAAEAMILAGVSGTVLAARIGIGLRFAR